MDSPSRSRSSGIAWLKAGLLCLVLVPDLFRWPDLWAELGTAGFLRIPPVFAILALATVAAALVQGATLRWIFAAVLGAATMLIHGYQFSTGTDSTYFGFVTTVDARSALPDTIALYWRSLAASGATGLACALGVGLKPPPLGRRARTAAIIVPVVTAIALVVFLTGRQGQIRGIPAAWKGVGYAGLYMLDRAQGIGGERQEVTIGRTGDGFAGDIILIVDESVSGNYLDLNAPGGARSGLADPVPGWSITNFGIAASITNCSMQTNVGLRYGATRERYRQHIAAAPSIWAYARNAGLRTVYLYGQRGGFNENYVTDAERLEIDEQLYFRHVPFVERDHRIAEEIAARIDNGTREFILVNKVGTHFPLIASYPGDQGPFRPEADIDAGEKDAGFWRLYRNNYRNAIEWSVGQFFDRIFASAGQDRQGSGQGAVVIYTSDHGQTFFEREEAGSVTHCRVEGAAMEEGAVPLVVATMPPAVTSALPDWDAALPARNDATSQYRIFPTLLELMGYAPAEVREVYGPSITSQDADPMLFGVRMHLRFGPEPIWVRLDPDEVFRPD